jgi:hypothetical protein
MFETDKATHAQQPKIFETIQMRCRSFVPFETEQITVRSKLTQIS